MGKRHGMFGTPVYNVYIRNNGKQQHLGSTADFFEACCIRKSAESRIYL